MKRHLGLTMRVVETQYSSGNTEQRDALAHDWTAFLHTVVPEIPWMSVPNAESDAIRLVNAFGINGLVLTGGDDWGRTPMRDTTETRLLEWALQQRIPVFGVCRGAQVINCFLGGKISPMQTNHTATRHFVTWQSQTIEVNSYHKLGIFPADLAPDLRAMASSKDGTLEGFRHATLPWVGVMWHPERETPCAPFDQQLFRNLFMENA